MSDSILFRRKSRLRRIVAAAMALNAAAVPLAYIPSVLAQEAASEEGEVADLSDITVTDDPLRALSNEPSGASFGFAKPLLETPRTVTFVSEEQLRLFGVSTVEDLSRLVPGTYTTTRYGLQGGISVRGVSADFYYRGVKRLQMQGHVRTVLSAYDNIEVIKGPPSPLYGMGQVGGYANLDPKSNRAKTGKYMTKEQGYLQATTGSYNKGEMQFGLGIPFTVAGKTAGAYVVGLLEDSDTFVRTVPAQQKFLQATLSVDNVIGNFRLETGGQMQNSVTAGAYFTRVTQDMIDNDTYITGRPLANLDLNGDGRIGYVETYLGSPVGGAISGFNQALDQRYLLGKDTNGNPLPLSTFANSIAGIPKSMKDYLTTGPGANLDCAMANYMRSEAVPTITPAPRPTATNPAAPGAILVTSQLPIGFVLDPCNTGTTTLSNNDYRNNGAYEREQNATQRMFYFDLINDFNPDFTIKNQFFFDSIDSFKDSWLPYGENQEIHMWEDKLTVTKRIPSDKLPEWLSVNTLGSINYRDIKGWIRSSGGDFDYRQDITYQTYEVDGSGTGGFYPNTMFWTQLTNNSYQTGVPNSRDNTSEYTENGIGLMFDIDLFRKTNLVLGGRFDKVRAKVTESPLFNPNTGRTDASTPSGYGPTPDILADYIAGLACTAPLTNQCPGAFRDPGEEVKTSDSGTSVSASLSHKLPWAGMTPYVTVAQSTITLDSSNNMYSRDTVLGGKLVGEAELQEVGIKGTALGRKMQWTLAWFNQERTDVSNPSDPSVASFATSTATEGVETSLNYQPTRDWFIGAAVTYLDARYLTGLTTGQQVDVTARELGFQDIVTPDGQVYPAEAFGYGGRLRVLIDDPNNIYDELPGSPKVQASMNTTYNLGKGFGLLANIQYFDKSWANRIQTVEIPEATVYNIGATWDSARVHLKANIYNLTDEIYFRATNGGNSNMASIMADRRYEISLKVDF